LKVRDIMAKNVASTNPSSTVIDVARIMQKHNIGSVPVCDQNGLVGIVTDRDIVVRNVAHGTDPQTMPVQNVMTSKVITSTPDMDAIEVSKLMASQRIRRLPVVENNKLVGMISLGDIATNMKFSNEPGQTLSDVSTPSAPQNM